ncbi:MAG TPA: outer-membrane lipoprotein carrier protein LolA [Sphingomicrobium sp.]|nr:outer-membrane lipoprotein carrier protein LolA [Sphingomicrobium sp.]
MSFPSSFARALVPAIAVAIAAPGAAAQSPDLARLKAHISQVQTMTADFTQTDARGRSASGKLQMKRPGRVRFEYSSGDLLLVANGRNLTFIDYQVGQKSSWPLNKTPLGALLSGSPDFDGKAEILPSESPRVVVARARNTSQYGQLTLAFLRNASAPGGLELYGWTAIDPQKRRTTVRLTNVRYNGPVSDGAFTFREPQKRKR